MRDLGPCLPAFRGAGAAVVSGPCREWPRLTRVPRGRGCRPGLPGAQGSSPCTWQIASGLHLLPTWRLPEVRSKDTFRCFLGAGLVQSVISRRELRVCVRASLDLVTLLQFSVATPLHTIDLALLRLIWVSYYL